MTKGTLHLDGWAGRRDHPVEIVGETPKRYRVKVLSAGFRIAGRTRRYGDIFLAPKHAVTVETQPA